jgi:hypothetical protein
VSQLDHLETRGWLTADAAQAVREEYAERQEGLRREAEIEARLREARRLEPSAPARAAAHYEEVLRLDPTQVPAYHRLVALYEWLHRPEDLFRVCAVGSRYDPGLGQKAEAVRAEQERQVQIQARLDALHRARVSGDPAALEAAA